MNIRYSVLIVTYNSMSTIGNCLLALKSAVDLQETEIIIVDNNSQDATPGFLNSQSGIKVILNSHNLGFSEAVNIAARNSSGEYLVLLNPDTLVVRGFLPSMAKFIEADDQVGAVGPISNYAAAWQSLRYYHPRPAQFNDPAKKDEIYRYLQEKYLGKAKVNKILIGFCLLVRRDVFMQLGMLDGQLVLGLDDLDLCWRLTLANYKLIVAQDTFVYHKGQVSFEAAPSDMVKKMSDQSLAVLSKKLVEHYGGYEEIPSANELWDIDWFKPMHPEEYVRHIPESPKPELSRQPKQGALILCLYHEKDEKALQYSLASLEPIKEAFTDVLLLNFSGVSSRVESLLIDLDEWMVAKQTTWGTLVRKLNRWFGSDGVLLWISAGVKLNISIPSMLAEVKPGEIHYGKTHGSNQALHLTEIDPSLVLNKELPEFFAFHAIPTKKFIPKRHDAWVLPMYEVQEHSWVKDATLPTMAQTRFPEVLLAYLEQYQSAAVLARGQCLDLQGAQCEPDSVELLIIKINTLDAHSLPSLLKQRRLSKRNKKIVVVFPNAWYGSHGEFHSKGLNPWNVLQWVNQAGFVITQYLCYPLNKELPEKVEQDHLQWDYWTHREKAFYAFPEILLELESCKDNYQKDLKVSIIILAINKREYTQKCVESIQKNVKQNYELILVDNGSSDDTLSYFQSVNGAVVVANKTNLGVAAGWNQGLEIATGEFVLILNNDTLVGPNAIENMVRALQNHPNTAMVAPRSNAIAGPQVVANFTAKSEKEIYKAAKEWQKEHDHASWEFSRIKGFCMLMPRSIVQEVGLFDERFGIGNFEDDDYSCRLRQAGYQIRVADDSFVFHYGSVSFGQAGIDWNQQMITNQTLFEEKWKLGRQSQTAYFRKEPARNQILTQLDPDCKDEVLLLQLARKYSRSGDKEQAFTVYLHLLDVQGEKQSLIAEVMEFLHQYSHPNEVQAIADALKEKYPMFATKLGNHVQPFESQVGTTDQESKVIEQLLENGDFYNASLRIHMNRQKDPQNWTFVNLQGVLWYYQKMYDKAFAEFEKALELNPTDEDLLLNFYDTGLRVKLYEKTIEKLEYALSLQPHLESVRKCLEELLHARDIHNLKPESLIYYREWNLVAENQIREGLLDEAEKTLQSILAEEPDNFRALNNMGLLAWYRKESELAFDFFEQAVQKNPWYSDSVLNLFDAAFIKGTPELVIPYLEKALRLNPGNTVLKELEVELAAGKLPERLKCYVATMEPTLVEQKKQEAIRCLDEGEFDAAVLLFSDLLAENLEDAEAYNGLGIVSFYREQYDDAYHLFERSLEIQPISRDALMNFYDVAMKLGRKEDAIMRIKNACNADAGLQDLLELVGEG
jgi:GT2 family glycosyltransferase/Flp pilus assembly protein TadD